MTNENQWDIQYDPEKDSLREDFMNLYENHLRMLSLSDQLMGGCSESARYTLENKGYLLKPKKE